MYAYETKIQEKFDDLSPTLKRVALFLKDNPKLFASNSATKIANMIGVSETSVIRFVYAINYGSFTDLQNEVQDSIFDLKNSLMSLSQTFTEQTNHTGIEEVMIRDQINIKKTAENIDPEVFKTVVKRIALAREIVVLGSGASYGFAHWFSFTLNTIRGNSRILNLYMDDFSYINNLDENSVVVTFSFNRYMKHTLEITQELKARGVYVVGITDSDIAPITQIADSTFVTKMSHMSTIDSGPVISSLLNTILNQMIQDYPEQYEKQKQQYETTYKDLFWNEGLHHEN